MSSGEAEVKSLCQQLIPLVGMMLDPRTPRERRIETYQKLEEFKQSSPMVLQCGIALGQPQQDAIVRHFGLKVLEDVIKLRWNDMSLDEKVFVKNEMMKLLADPREPPPHVKDVISRPVVEIAKREWPQHWPTMLAELNELCQKGEVQTEITMMVILRLVEDVAVLQNLEQTQRRKEIYQALTSNMEEIFQFLLGHLERHYQAYQTFKQANDFAGAQRHCKVCRAVLETFSSFIEWVSMSHIMANDKYLIRCLCHLLSDDYLQLNAAECLLNVVSWKSGKAQDRMQLLALFSNDMMAPLFAATERANAKALEEEHYNVLKKMVQIFAELGGQLCALWSKDGSLWTKEMANSKRPQNFDTYLNALLAFTHHSSHTVNMYVNELWVKFFRHTDIFSDDVFVTYIAKWVEIVVKKCVKSGLPSRDDSPSCGYSLLDFDNDEEFLSFFGRYRLIITEGLRLISAENPSVTFRPIERWLNEILSSPLNFGDKNSRCTNWSPVFLELEAIANVLDAVLGKVSQNQLTPFLPSALELTRKCLSYPSSDPVLSSAILSCTSSLFAAVSASGHNDLLMETLKKIFSSITYVEKSNTDSGTMTDQCRMLRRHGCSLMVKLGTRHPAILLPLFNHLRDTVMSMNSSNQLFQGEFVTLVEALVLISNEFKNYHHQCAFLMTISEPVCTKFRQLEPAIQSPSALMDFVGLTKSSSESTEEPSKSNRGELHFAVNLLLSVCRRAAAPDTLDACRSGGFILSESGDKVALRNPAWIVAGKVLPHVFMLVKTMNHLWEPGNLAKLHPDYTMALSMIESEKNTITGVGNRAQNMEAKTKTPLSRMQTFLFEIYENNYHLLSQFCTSCGYEFYKTPQLSTGIIGSVIDGINFLPDYRLRAIIRMFLKSLINKCPQSSYSDVLAPILQSLVPYMLTRLTDRWKHLIVLRESPNFDENNTDSQEVIDDVVCRHLAREYLDVVKAILTSGGGSDIPVTSLQPSVSNGVVASSISLSDDNNGSQSNVKSSNGAPTLSDLGKLVIEHDPLCQYVIETLLRALVWPDSPSSVRASLMLELVLPVLIQGGKTSDNDASRIMISIISAIHELGQHEANYIALIQLAIQSYEWLRPKHESIVNVLAQVPGCNPDDLKRFDDKMMALASGKETTKGGDRAKKDMFKKLINQFIGKDLAKLFKHEVVIKNLPTPVMSKHRQKTPSLDETERGEIGISSLFSQNGHHS